MTQEELEKGTFAAACAQLVEDKVSFIVPAENYNVKNDNRLLIPYIKNQKIGFVNRDAVSIVEPIYDIVNGEVLSENDFVKVGIRYSYGFSRGKSEPWTGIHYKFGLLDSKGNVVFKPQYSSISVSDDGQIFTLRHQDEGYCVVNLSGEVIIPFERFSLIDGFTNGYARIKKDNKWGIIDVNGNLALPIEYDSIWSFFEKKELKSTKVIKDGHEDRFYF